MQFGDVEHGAARPAEVVSLGVVAALLGEVEEPGASAAIDDHIGMIAHGAVCGLGAGLAQKVPRLLMPGG